MSLIQKQRNKGSRKSLLATNVIV